MDDPPTVEPSTLVAIDEVLSDLQRVGAALANREQILEDMKTEFANDLNPEKLASRVVDNFSRKLVHVSLLSPKPCGVLCLPRPAVCRFVGF